MTVNQVAAELEKLVGTDRDKDVIAQTVDAVTFDTVIRVEPNEDNVALFVDRYVNPKE